MNKIPCTSQNTEAKTLPADVCFFDHFWQLSPAAVHSADSWFDSGVKWCIHVSSIVTYLCKNTFLLCWNSCKQRSELLLFLIDSEQMQHTLWKQLSHWQMFMQNDEYTTFWYLQLLCYLTQLKFTISQNKFVEFFFLFSGTTAEFGRPERSASFVSLWPHLKWAHHLLTVISDGAESEWYLSSHCFAWTVFFPIIKQSCINTCDSDFSIVLKICNSSFI